MSNPSNFRSIDFTEMLYQTLTGFFSINKALLPTWGYKFCAACLTVFQGPFASFDAFRQKEYLVANCKWQIGQLTNMLNKLYDSTLNRIYITQSIANPEFFWQFAYPPSMFLSDFGTAPMQFLEQFGNVATTIVTIHVPNTVPLSDLTAVVAQISITGIPYQIVFI